MDNEVGVDRGSEWDMGAGVRQCAQERTQKRASLHWANEWG